MIKELLRPSVITKRWMKRVLLTVIIAIIIFEIVTGIFLYTYCRDSAINNAESFVRPFGALASADGDDFTRKSKEFAENFTHSDYMTVQIFDTDGNITAKTDDSYVPAAENTDDYIDAFKNDSKSAENVSENRDGTSLYSETFLLENGTDIKGAVRWTIPCSAYIAKFLIVLTVTILLGIAVIIIVSLTCLYFNRSIIAPVREVGLAARKIALGDFDTRLEIADDGEIGELCNTINYMAEELRASEDMKNDFISSVSHELRTPLTAIKGWGETAKMAVGADDELVERGISVILTEAQRLQGLVEQLLDFSRIQSSNLSLNITDIDISSVIDQSAEIYDKIGAKDNITLKLSRPYKLRRVSGDSDRLKQVFINVIDNAVKYNVSGGTVDITVTHEPEYLTVAVRDTGIGIPKDDIDRVKEKFYKANKQVRGSGIGLAVADEIMRQHNGYLTVESRLGDGTTVYIRLPYAHEEGAYNG